MVIYQTKRYNNNCNNVKGFKETINFLLVFQ